MGATEIIALDLGDGDSAGEKNSNVLVDYVDKLSLAIMRRQIALETALAKAHGVPVYRIRLTSPIPTPIWAFNNYPQLIAAGYKITRQQIASWDRNSHAIPSHRRLQTIPFSLLESNLRNKADTLPSCPAT